MDVVVLLHNIRSLHNVGSIFRTADAAGVKKIYLSGITPTPTDRFGKVRAQVAKVALGAEQTVPWKHVPNTENCITELKKDDYNIYALEQHPSSVPYHHIDVLSGQKIALVLGPEVDGLPELILKESDTIVEIPMHGEKESLNVSVAFGIVIFHFINSHA